MTKAATGAPSSLMRSVLLRIVLAASLIVAALTVMAYAFIYTSTQDRMLENLGDWVVERTRNDSFIFELAQENLDRFRDEYLRLYTAPIAVSEQEFLALFQGLDDGSMRTPREYYEGVFTPEGVYRYGMTGFIGNNQAVDDPDFQRRLVLAFRLLAQLGPAEINRFFNVHASFPENALVLFSPEVPWGLEARADLRMNELGVIQATLAQNNPQRMPVWTGLYFDETAEEWVITYQLPVDFEGRHLINPSHDIPLSSLLQRLVRDSPSGGHNFIIRSDGHLVAHPVGPSEEQQWVGQLSLDKIDSPVVVEAYRLIHSLTDGSPGEISIIDYAANNSYLAVSELSGPDWWFVSVYPKRLIRESVNRAAAAVAISGLILLVLLVMIMFWIMRRDAEEPLRRLQQAAQAIARGGHAQVASGEVPLPRDINNEIGLLANTFYDMAVSINNSRQHLERVVVERTHELEDANILLRELSLLDGLLGIHNRRAFDRDIERVFVEAQRGEGEFYLMLADIDAFKLFNDSYGHLEGDRVLRRIAEALRASIRDVDRVYRYGGEELAVIFNQTDARQAWLAAARVMETVRGLGIAFPEFSHGIVTISAGLAAYEPGLDSHEAIIEAADRHLYEAKRRGRNCLIS